MVQSIPSGTPGSSDPGFNLFNPDVPVAHEGLAVAMDPQADQACLWQRPVRFGVVRPLELHAGDGESFATLELEPKAQDEIVERAAVEQGQRGLCSTMPLKRDEDREGGKRQSES